MASNLSFQAESDRSTLSFKELRGFGKAPGAKSNGQVKPPKPSRPVPKAAGRNEAKVNGKAEPPPPPKAASQGSQELRAFFQL